MLCGQTLMSARGGSTISLAKAVVRLSALCTVPLLAVPVMHRSGLELPRWLLYATGAATLFGLATATNGTSIWLGALLLIAVEAVILTAAALVVLKHDALIRFASQLLGPPDN